jgi:hypothetical protein
MGSEDKVLSRKVGAVKKKCYEKYSCWCKSRMG